MKAAMNLQLVSTIIISALTGAAMALIAERWTAPPQMVATIDPTVLVTEQLRDLEPGLDDQEIQQRGQDYAKRLDAAIASLARESHLTILVKPVVVTGAPDLTDEVRRRLRGLP